MEKVDPPGRLDSAFQDAAAAADLGRHNLGGQVHSSPPTPLLVGIESYSRHHTARAVAFLAFPLLLTCTLSPTFTLTRVFQLARLMNLAKANDENSLARFQVPNF